MKLSINNKAWLVLIIGLAVGFYSCSDMDEYKDYMDEGEIDW